MQAIRLLLNRTGFFALRFGRGADIDCCSASHFGLLGDEYVPAVANIPKTQNGWRHGVAKKLTIIAAMKPCPCGWRGTVHKQCTCAEATATRYQKRFSGPLLDRIDKHIEVPSVNYEKLSSDKLGETTETIRKRVQVVRDIQNKRFANGESKDIIYNADMRVGDVRQFCQLQSEGQSLMRAATSQLILSARAYHRILKLSCTIADLVGSEEIQSAHLAEALQHRQIILLVPKSVILVPLIGYYCGFAQTPPIYLDKKDPL